MEPASTRFLLIVSPSEKKMGVIDSSIQRDKVELKDIKEVNVAIKSLKGFKGAMNSLRLLSPFRTWVKVGIQGRTDETGKLHKVLMDINKLAKATGLKKSDIRKLVRSGNGVAKLEAAMNGVAISELTKPVPKPKSTKKVKAQKGAEDGKLNFVREPMRQLRPIPVRPDEESQLDLTKVDNSVRPKGEKVAKKDAVKDKKFMANIQKQQQKKEKEFLPFVPKETSTKDFRKIQQKQEARQEPVGNPFRAAQKKAPTSAAGKSSGEGKAEKA